MAGQHPSTPARRSIPSAILEAIPADASAVAGIDITEVTLWDDPECYECGAPIEKQRFSNRRTVKLCSDKCRRKKRKTNDWLTSFRRRWGVPLICNICHGQIRSARGVHGTCSKECALENARRRNHWAWVANREERNAGIVAWSKTPEGRSKKLAIDNRYRSRKYGAHLEPWTREEILERDGRWCYLCESPIDEDAHLAFDHVRPLDTWGGADAPWNIAPAHRGCNSRKKNRFCEKSQRREEELLKEYGCPPRSSQSWSSAPSERPHDLVISSTPC